MIGAPVLLGSRFLKFSPGDQSVQIKEMFNMFKTKFQCRSLSTLSIRSNSKNQALEGFEQQIQVIFRKFAEVPKQKNQVVPVSQFVDLTNFVGVST